MNNDQKRLVFLDFIRVVAVLLIILYHFHPVAFYSAQPSGTIPALTLMRQPLGDFGVTLFIIVSAAALMTSTSKQTSLSDFYIKRFLAIFPSYGIAYLVVGVALFVGRGAWVGDDSHWKIAFTVLGLDGFLFYDRSSYYLVGEWFVGFILCLYAIFPFLKRCVLTRPAATAVAVAIVFAILHIYYGKLFSISENRNPLLRLPEFLFGLCFLQYVRPRIREWALASAAVLLVLVFWMPPVSSQVYGILLGISWFCVLSFLSDGPRIPASVARFLGVASKYAFLAFLVHHQIIQAARAHFVAMLGPLETAALFVLVVLSSFGVAVVLSPLVEALARFLSRALTARAPRQRTMLVGSVALLVVLIGGLISDIGNRTPSIDRKFAALASRLGMAPVELNGMKLREKSPRYAEAIALWAQKSEFGVYGTRWWKDAGVVRYSSAARNDTLCSGSVDLLVPSGPRRGGQGWVKTSSPQGDVLILLTNEADETVGYGISGVPRVDVASLIPGARRDAGWLALASAQPTKAYAYVDGSFCKI